MTEEEFRNAIELLGFTRFNARSYVLHSEHGPSGALTIYGMTTNCFIHDTLYNTVLDRKINNDRLDEMYSILRDVFSHESINVE